MLTKTSITAIQLLLYLVERKGRDPVAPAEAAAYLGASSTYLSKINTQLVKAQILAAHRGVNGGVTLARSPKDVTLLDIVEACQGKILGDYCTPHTKLDEVCAFHQAMVALQRAIVDTLRGWTLATLAARPRPAEHLRSKVACRMAGAREAGDKS